jgi:hypothetical protein
LDSEGDLDVEGSDLAAEEGYEEGDLNTEKKKSLYIHSYTHMVVHTSMYDGEEA